MSACSKSLGSLVFILACGSAIGQTESAPSEALQHVQKAVAIAKDDPVLMKDAASMCPKPAQLSAPSPAAAPAQAPAMRDPVINYTVVEPTKVFDNLYHVGIVTVGSWILKTSDGIILIDANNDNKAVEEAMLPGFKKLGLDPAQIKYVIVTHAHGDHFGGAQYLKDHYGTRIVMSEIDWQGVSKPIFFATGNPDPSPRPTRDAKDIGITDHGTLTLGDTTVTLVVTPGHTPGTMSMLFPIKYQGKTYNAMLWGAGNMTQFLPPLERFVNEFAKPAKPVARLSSHLMADGMANLEQINKNPGGPNPYFYGEERFGRYLDIAVECAKASARPAP